MALNGPEQIEQAGGGVTRLPGLGDEFALAAVGALVGQLRGRRQRLGITQASLADALDLAVLTVAGWEALRDLPSTRSFLRWADALGFTVAIVDRSRAQFAARPLPRMRHEPVEQYRVRRLASILKDIRREAGHTQAELSGLIDISIWTLQMWESGRRVPQLKRLVAWSDVLGCQVVLIPV